MIIDKRKIYTFFKNRYVLRKPSNGWYPFDCPFCPDGDRKAKHAVNFEFEFTKCWSHCGFRGRIVDFVMQLEGIDYPAAKAMLGEQEESRIDLDILDGLNVSHDQVSEVTLPYGYVGLLEGVGSLGDRARAYLEGRNFDLNVLDSMGIGYSNKHHPDYPLDKKMDYFGYIIVPFKRRGKLQYYLGRDFIGNYERYKNPATEVFGVGKSEVIFNEDALELYKRVFVLEGWTDAVTIGREATATLGWSLSPIQKGKYMHSKAEELVFVPDKGYYAKAVQLAASFLDVKKVVKVVNLEEESVEDKDVNSMGIERFNYLFKHTAPLTFAEAVNYML